MKALIFCLIVAIAVLIITTLVRVIEEQVYIPQAGNQIGPVTPTPTLTATEAISATGTLTPTKTPRPTTTPSLTPSITPTDANSPTITPTPTKTGTPTTTPTITPTPTDTIGQGVIVLNDHFAYVNDDGFLTVVGEVRNDTSSNATNMKVVVTLYNNHQDALASMDTYAWLDVLKPKDKTCFEVVFDGNPTYSKYGLDTVFANTASVPRPLEIFSQGEVYIQDDGEWDMFGQIRNTGTSTMTLTFPQVIGTLYDAVGHVVDCTFVAATAEKLAAGESSTWEMRFRPLPEVTPVVYRVQPR